MRCARSPPLTPFWRWLAANAFRCSIPAGQYLEAAKACRQIGTWPVLRRRREKGERDAMLSSPIILYDYPKIAPESPGDLFDGAEIDEILTLRIQTMTDAEKTEMRQVDEHARRILERTENLAEADLLKFHGVMRATPSPQTNEEFFNPAKRGLGGDGRGGRAESGRPGAHPAEEARRRDGHRA